MQKRRIPLLLRQPLHPLAAVASSTDQQQQQQQPASSSSSIRSINRSSGGGQKDPTATVVAGRRGTGGRAQHPPSQPWSRSTTASRSITHNNNDNGKVHHLPLSSSVKQQQQQSSTTTKPKSQSKRRSTGCSSFGMIVRQQCPSSRIGKVLLVVGLSLAVWLVVDTLGTVFWLSLDAIRLVLGSSRRDGESYRPFWIHHRTETTTAATAEFRPKRGRRPVQPRWLTPHQLNEKEEIIDMRVLNYELPFSNNNSGAPWSQGWDLVPTTTTTNSSLLQVFVVPHSHCDVGRHRTFNETVKLTSNAILTTVVQALRLDARRTFVWAEMALFAAWWHDQDESVRTAVRTLMDHGQFEFVTGGWVVADEANAQYSALETQVREGHEWIRTHVGEPYLPRSGWAVDGTGGHSSAVAHLWKQYNLTAMVIHRVHYAVKKELARRRHLEFFWRQTWEIDRNSSQDRNNSSDTTSRTTTTMTMTDPYNGQRIQPHDIFTHIMPFFNYGIPHTCGPDPAACGKFDFARLIPTVKGSRTTWENRPQPITVKNVRERAELLLDQYRRKAALYRSNAVLVPLGDDFRYQSSKEAELQYKNYQIIFDYINANIPGVQIQFGTLSEYFQAARESFDGPVPILTGSFFPYADADNDYWSGLYTTRASDKSLDRDLERVLYAAETMNATNMELSGARRALSLFQHHDGVSGTSKDAVSEDYASRLFQAVRYVNAWMINTTLTKSDIALQLSADERNDIRPCWVSPAPRVPKTNFCNSTVVLYNPLLSEQSCGKVTVKGRQFAKASVPCEVPGPAIMNTSRTEFVFDPETGMMLEPIREEWKVWKVNSGGAYLFVPELQITYDMSTSNLKILRGGFEVSTTFWKRAIIERHVTQETGRSATVLDFVYETAIRPSNQEWFVRLSSPIANKGYFHTDLNGFNFETHRFREDMPIQSQVYPMPTMASIQDDRLRMTVLSDHAHGTASLLDGSIDVVLDRTLEQDDKRGLFAAIHENRPIRSRLRVVLEQDGYSLSEEFNLTQFCRHMLLELQHPLELFGKHKANVNDVPDIIVKAKSKLEAESDELVAREVAMRKKPMGTGLRPRAIRSVTNKNHAFNSTIVPFVYMVYRREDYLKSAMESLKSSDFPRHRVPIIISHDGRVPEVVEYVKSLSSDFQVIQLFHPHACYDHPDTFPGDDPTLNEGYAGDAYGNPRSFWITCCKHHFTWMLKTVFSLQDFIEKNTDTFLFLEEDYVVGPTIYQAIVNGLNAMDEFAGETRGGFLGLSLDPTSGNLKPGVKGTKIVMDYWKSLQFVSGPMTLHRNTFTKIKEYAAFYCGIDGFDEYNWDWSFVHMQTKWLIPHTVLSPGIPLVRHIGIEGGMHGHKKRVPMPRVEFERLEVPFLGEKIAGSPGLNPKPMKKGNGGWGHPADQAHCLELLS